MAIGDQDFPVIVRPSCDEMAILQGLFERLLHA
jgi:hypothetical protein